MDNVMGPETIDHATEICTTAMDPVSERIAIGEIAQTEAIAVSAQRDKTAIMVDAVLDAPSDQVDQESGPMEVAAAVVEAEAEAVSEPANSKTQQNIFKKPFPPPYF